MCPLDVIKTRLQVHGRPQLGNGTVKGFSSFTFALFRIHFVVYIHFFSEFNSHKVAFFFFFWVYEYQNMI